MAQAFGPWPQCAAVLVDDVGGGAGQNVGGGRICNGFLVVGGVCGLVPVPCLSLPLFSSLQLVACSFGRRYHRAFAPCVLRASCDLVGILLPAICHCGKLIIYELCSFFILHRRCNLHIRCKRSSYTAIAVLHAAQPRFIIRYISCARLRRLHESSLRSHGGLERERYLTADTYLAILITP